MWNKKKNYAVIAKKVGAIYCGLIFIKNSKRNINISTALNIVQNVHMKYVAVFQNELISIIVNITKIIPVYAIQLHGTENQKYINKLKKKINSDIQIWKAIGIINEIPIINFNNIQKYIFDNHKGGSGNTFNWSLIKKNQNKNILLAGGINIKNCIQASNMGFMGLDLNSGVEIYPGCKSEKKIKKIFELIGIN